MGATDMAHMLLSKLENSVHMYQHAGKMPFPSPFLFPVIASGLTE
jgi:hypothetical protein